VFASDRLSCSPLFFFRKRRLFLLFSYAGDDGMMAFRPDMLAITRSPPRPPFSLSDLPLVIALTVAYTREKKG